MRAVSSNFREAHRLHGTSEIHLEEQGSGGHQCDCGAMRSHSACMAAMASPTARIVASSAALPCCWPAGSRTTSVSERTSSHPGGNTPSGCSRAYSPVKREELAFGLVASCGSGGGRLRTLARREEALGLGHAVADVQQRVVHVGQVLAAAKTGNS